MPVITKGNNVSEEKNHVVTKGNNALLQKDIRNITDTTINNTERESLRSSQEPTIIEIETAISPAKQIKSKDKKTAFRF